MKKYVLTLLAVMIIYSKSYSQNLTDAFNVNISYGIGLYMPSQGLTHNTFIEYVIYKKERSDIKIELSYFHGGPWGDSFTNKGTTLELSYETPDKIRLLNLGARYYFELFRTNNNFNNLEINVGCVYQFGRIDIPEVTNIIPTTNGVSIEKYLHVEKLGRLGISCGMNYNLLNLFKNVPLILGSRYYYTRSTKSIWKSNSHFLFLIGVRF